MIISARHSGQPPKLGLLGLLFALSVVHTGPAAQEPPLEADLALTGTDAPDPVTAGQQLTYTLMIQNDGPQSATGVTLTDDLPAGVTLGPVTPSQGSCGTDPVVCDLGTIESGAQATVTLKVTPTTAGTITNQATVGANEPDPNPGNNAASEPTTVEPIQADLALTGTDAPDPVTAGQQLTYTLTVRNNGPQSATGVTLTDDLPAGVTLGPVTPSQGSCGTDPVVCDLGTIESGAQATVTLKVTPTTAGTITNQATVGANEPDPNPGNNAASEPTTVEPPADLALTGTDAPDPVTAGQQLTYTLTVRNNGPQSATGVTLTDDLPAGVTLGPVTPSQGSCGTDPVVCDLGTIESGAQATVTLKVTPTTAGTITNQATVGANEPDPNPGNNAASEPTTVEPIQADLALTGTDAPDPVTAGQQLTYTLTVRNNGPQSATGVTLTDDLPAGVTLGPVTPSQGSCGTDPVVCDLGTIESGAQATVTLTVTPTTAGTITNRATVHANEDPNPGNDSVSTATTVDPLPPAFREIRGELMPGRPTIVLTHGLEADVASLWTGFSATPGAQGAGHTLNNLLGQQVNIVQFLWEEGLQGFSAGAYSAAFPYTQDAGAGLADLLIERLGPGYDLPIHFIGHSLGAVVNAYAARRFLIVTPGVALSQFTILDYPSRTPSDTANAPPIPAGFFATLLQDLRDSHGLRIDNFHSQDPSALGNLTEGPIENHPKLRHPSNVGGLIFPAEPPASDHAGVQQWYRWTMNPNGLTGATFCETGTFNKPPSFSASLNPCRKGWHGSLFGPKPRPDPDPEPPVDVISTPLELENPQPDGCEFAGGEITCPEQSASSSSITFDVDIPAAASFIEFEFAFSGADEGDFGAVFLGVPDAAISGPARSSIPQESAVQNMGAHASPIAVLSASITLPNGDFQSLGPIALPTSQARGRGTMTMSNHPASHPGSTFRVRHVRIASVCPERCFGKRATICGSRDHDRLTGTAARDVIVGLQGNDTIKGLKGNDLICGGSGKDKLVGGQGKDRLDGGGGKDKLNGGRGEDTCKGGGRADSGCEN